MPSQKGGVVEVHFATFFIYLLLHWFDIMQKFSYQCTSLSYCITVKTLPVEGIPRIWGKFTNQDKTAFSEGGKNKKYVKV